jgi:hypothetical protein
MTLKVWEELASSSANALKLKKDIEHLVTFG